MIILKQASETRAFDNIKKQHSWLLQWLLSALMAVFLVTLVLTTLFLTTMFIATSAVAQEGGASLRGDVLLDPGINLDAVDVVVVDIDSGYRRTSGVASDGSYIFPSLRPGRYRLEMITADRVRKTQEFTLQVGQNSVLDLDFRNTEIEEVIVVANAITVQQGGEVGVNITPDLIESLPQNSRNFLAFADLAPGVSFQTDGNGATRIQGGVQASSTVNVFIDGVGQKDFVLKNGVTGQDSSPGNPFPQSAIGEYRVISQNYKAEFDQVSSAAIIAVTKSGTNEFHGDVFWDFTDEGLREETPREKDLGDGKIATEISQFGASLGGPIIKDKLHFFFAYEGKRNKVPVEVSAAGGVTAADLPPRYASLLGAFNRDFEEDLFFVKFDFSPTDDDLVQFSVKIRDETGTRHDNGENARSFSHDINNDEIRILLAYEHSENNWINDLKLTYEESAFNPQPDRENTFTLELSGKQTILNVGGHPNFQDKGQEGFGIQNDFTWTGFNDHIIKAGIKIKWVELATVQQQPFNPQYRFNTEFDATGTGAFNDVVPYRLRLGSAVEGLGDGTANSDNVQLGLYIQDDWQITARLELSYGIRWDYEETPIYLDYVTPADALTALRAYSNIQNTDYNINDFISTGSNRDVFKEAFAPRLGFNYDLTDDGQLTLFGGIGRSYDRNQFDFIQGESTKDTFRTLIFNFDTGDPDNPCPDCLPFDPIYFTQAGRDMLIAGNPTTGSGRELRLITNDLKVPYSDQLSFGVRAGLGEWDTEAGFSHIRARDGFAWLLGNRRENGEFFAPGTIFESPFGFSPAGFGNILLGVNGIESDADSIYLKGGKAYDNDSGWAFNATYTYTDAETNRQFGEVFSLNYPSLDDYPVLTASGISKHRFVATGSYDLPWEIKLSGKFTYRSAEYIEGVGRPGVANDQRQLRVTKVDDNYKQLDLALVKSIDTPGPGNTSGRFRVRVDVLNVLNEENFDAFIGNGGSEDFGKVRSFDIGGNLPRTYKLSVGWSF